jgi:hypothetical protein
MMPAGVVLACLAALAPPLEAAIGSGDVCNNGTEEASWLQVGQRRLSAAEPQPWSSVWNTMGDPWPRIRSGLKDHPYVPKWPNRTARGGCTYKAGQDCSVASIKHWQYHNVYPGGETGCLDGSAYFFTVLRGDTEKLQIHFQGAGACWDTVTYNSIAPICYKAIDEEPPWGVFDLSNRRNPWRTYSRIIINCCSGDIHMGSAEHDWAEDGSKTKQQGFADAKAALEYALKNFPQLKQLSITGSSSGALAVQAWSGKVLDLFADRTEDIVVISDSFMGVLWPFWPPSKETHSEALLLRAWNACNPFVLEPLQVQNCTDGKLRLRDVWLSTMRKYPQVRFAALTSKEDFIQIAFEYIFELGQRKTPGFLMSSGDYYKYSSLMLLEWFKGSSNFYSYIVDGFDHTFLPDKVDSITPADSVAHPRMIQWLAELVNPGEGSKALRSVCSGAKKHLTPQTWVFPWETGFCAEELAGVK